jgi:hypothetical protein
MADVECIYERRPRPDRPVSGGDADHVYVQFRGPQIARARARGYTDLGAKERVEMPAPMSGEDVRLLKISRDRMAERDAQKHRAARARMRRLGMGTPVREQVSADGMRGETTDVARLGQARLPDIED